jgi:hypothetical protein
MGIGLLVGCAEPYQPSVNHSGGVESLDWISGDVYRVFDKETGVTCYVFVEYQKGGISCLVLER